MKKISILLMTLLLLGCSNKEVKPKEENNEIEQIEEVKEEYKDDNPIVVGIYENDYSLVTDYYTENKVYKDIVFSTYFTNDPTLIYGSVKNIWYNYYNNYENIENYRIGYNISFYEGDEFISENITHITDEYVFNPYFYVYLYDDIHQADGAWYSHITQEEDNENTMYTSIKLFLVDSHRITSPIKLTVFTYDSLDDFDSDGNYRGNSKYSININLK